MRVHLSIPAAICAFALAAGVAACGGSSSSSAGAASDGSATASMVGGAGTVSTKSVSGTGDVLVDSKGQALYTNNRDSGSQVACTGSCAAIWMPLMAPGGQPTSGVSAVQAKLGVVKLPKGGSQVTFGGKPLYTFVQDGPGEVTGNGVTDNFGGTSFTWTVASAPGTSTSSSATTSSSGGGSSGGGYGY